MFGLKLVFVGLFVFCTREILGATRENGREIENFKRILHQVSSRKVTLLDEKRVKIEGFKYDGGASAAYFWVGKGTKIDGKGEAIPDEKGNKKPLKGYNNETIVLSLPPHLTWNDVDYLAVWCKTYATNFGHTTIPKNIKF